MTVSKAGVLARLVDRAVAYRDVAQAWNAKQTFAAPVASGASINLPSGPDPAAPAEGDVWNGAGVLKAFLGGATRVLAVLGRAQIWGDVQTFAAGLVIQYGAIPAAFVNGRVWATDDGVFVRIAGASVQVADAAGVAGLRRGASIVAKSSTSFSTTSADYADVPNMGGQTTITNPGNAVEISGSVSIQGASSGQTRLAIVRDATVLQEFVLGAGASTLTLSLADTPGAGAHTYKLRLSTSNPSFPATFNGGQFIAKDIG